MTGARAWGGLTMAGIAAVAAVISYSDGLFLVRLAGNTDWHAYLYPLLPDGLIVICLAALLAAAKRPKWPTFGLGLGIALTLSMNVAAGIAHSPLDAVVDGFVPVVFFVAVEVFIGYVRRGRGAPAPVPVAIPVAAAKRVRLPSVADIRVEHNCSQATAMKIRAALRTHMRNVPAGDPPATAAPAGMLSPPAGVVTGAPPAPPAGAFNGGRAHG